MGAGGHFREVRLMGEGVGKFFGGGRGCGVVYGKKTPEFRSLEVGISITALT